MLMHAPFSRGQKCQLYVEQPTSVIDPLSRMAKRSNAEERQMQQNPKRVGCYYALAIGLWRLAAHEWTGGLIQRNVFDMS